MELQWKTIVVHCDLKSESTPMFSTRLNEKGDPKVAQV
jgi:hypothetical protein